MAQEDEVEEVYETESVPSIEQEVHPQTVKRIYTDFFKAAPT